MPPAGGWVVHGCTRLLRRHSSVIEHARFRYASGGQGAMKRWPLASPRSRGASPPLDPQRCMRGVPSAAASLRRKAPPGDLPPVPPMRTRLPLAWQSEGAFTFAPVATHMPPSKPGGIRFYARNVIVRVTRKNILCMIVPVGLAKGTFARRYAAAAGDHRRGFARRKLRRRGCAPQKERNNKHPPSFALLPGALRTSRSRWQITRRRFAPQGS